MKTIYFLIFALCFQAFLNAQVGINNNIPDNSAILDITSNNKGVLFPRMDLGNLTTAAPVTSPARGLTVWNTDAAAGGANEGLYYWNGTNLWVRLNTGTGTPTSGWALAGNSTAATNFLGTTNFQSLFMRVNNTQVMRLHPQAGAISLGFGASANDNRGIAIGNTAVNANGNDAVALGTRATTNSQNTLALGLEAATTGNDGIAIGTRARTSSQNNIAIGLEAAPVGNDAIAIGTRARTTSQNNIALGLDASASQNNATAIGHRASVNRAEAISLGRSDITDRNAFDYARIGMGTATPQEKLHVVGRLRLEDGTQAAGRVLTSDVNGVASWQASTAVPSYADVKLSNNLQVNAVTTTSGAISGTSTGVSSTDISTGSLTVTPTVAALYKITYNVTYSSGSGNGNVVFFLTQNTNLITGTEQEVFINGQERGVSVTTIRTLNANQAYGLGVRAIDSNATVNILGNRTAIVLERL